MGLLIILTRIVVFATGMVFMAAGAIAGFLAAISWNVTYNPSTMRSTVEGSLLATGVSAATLAVGIFCFWAALDRNR